METERWGVYVSGAATIQNLIRLRDEGIEGLREGTLKVSR